MEIRVIKGEIEAVAEAIRKETSATAIVLQANSAPIINERDPIVKPSKNGTSIVAFVPACISGVTSQMDKKRFDALSQCYLGSLRTASSAGYKTILVQELGKNLYWKSIRSAQAARKALETFSSESPDALVIFAIPESSYEAWDDIMRF